MTWPASKTSALSPLADGFCLSWSLSQDVWDGKGPMFYRYRSCPRGPHLSGRLDYSPGSLAFCLLPPVCLVTGFTALVRRWPMSPGSSLPFAEMCQKSLDCGKHSWWPCLAPTHPCWKHLRGKKTWSVLNRPLSYCFLSEFTREKEAVESILLKGKLRQVESGQWVKGCVSSPVFSPDELEVKGMMRVSLKRGKRL